MLYVASNSGVYQSIDDGLTWTLFPDTALGAQSEGGNLPHVDVTDLSLSLGNINSNTGMPNLAGPYEPGASASTPADPDLLLASTFGRGAFAINLAPIVFPSTVQIDPSSGTSDSVTTGQALIDWSQRVYWLRKYGPGIVSIVDETPSDPTFGQIIGGFDPAHLASTNVAANWTDASGNFSIPINANAFKSNGLKTIEVYATDDAGSVGNKVTLSFTVNAPLPPQPPTANPVVTLALAPGAIRGTTTGTDNGSPVTLSVTNLSTPGFVGTAGPAASVPINVQVSEFRFDPGDGKYDTAYGSLLTPTVAADGSFSFTFSNPSNLVTGNFKVVAVATYAAPFSSLTTTTSVYVQIDNTTPGVVADFRLNPADDTGIIGDNLTSNHSPAFIGTASRRAILIELFPGRQPRHLDDGDRAGHDEPGCQSPLLQLLDPASPGVGRRLDLVAGRRRRRLQPQSLRSEQPGDCGGQLRHHRLQRRRSLRPGAIQP